MKNDEPREKLREAIKEYVAKYWKYPPAEDELERYLAGVMAFIAVEVWDKPFTPIAQPVVVTEDVPESNETEGNRDNP